MASENVTTLLTIDAGEAFTKMSDYKKYLDNLKAALMGLEKGSEDYNAVLSKLNETQEKYAEVMDVSKGKNTEAADSYNALNKQLNELRKSYRNLSEDARNSPVGVAMLEGIKDLDSKLKDMDAQMGQYFRNVGDYRNAFIESFDKMLGPLSKVGGGFGKLLNDVKGMIPVIKNVTTSATKGLSGIKAAIASTGIGVLVIAVGELAANWDAVSDALERAFGGTSKLIMDAEALKNHFTEANYQLNLTLQKMQIIGATEWELNEFRLKQNSDRQIEIGKMMDANNKIIEEGTAAERKKAAAANETLSKEMDTLVVEHSHLVDNRELIKLKEKVAAEAKETADAENAAAEATRQGAAAAKARQAEYEKTLASAKALVETIRQTSLTPEQSMSETFERQKADLKKYYEDGYISAQQYYNSLNILTQNYFKNVDDLRKSEMEKAEKEAAASARKALDGAFSEIDKKLKDKKFNINLDLEKALGVAKTGGSLLDKLFGLKGKDAIQQEAKANIDAITASADAELSASREKVAELEASLADLTEGSDEWLRIQQLITAELEKQAAIRRQAAEDIQKIYSSSEEEQEEEWVKRWTKIANGIQQCSNMLNQYASYQQSVIQQDVQDGKISEEQAKKRFKNIKALQYGSIIMNTAAGSIIAMVTSIRDLGMPWGAIVGGIQAAAITASGAIQAATVAKQKFGSVNGNSITTPNMSPITNTYVPQYTANVQSNTELTELANAMGNISPVVRVTDINDVQNTVKVRQEENTF